MKRLLPLAGVSTLALMTAALAQDASNPIVLDQITLVADGQENIESTGGAVVTPEDIEVLQPNNVSELFARESAVSVSGGAGPSKRIHVFGIEQSKLAVTVDGVPQGPSSWHHTGSNIIDPAFIRAVEVEAGAAAADAGFAAGAGAVRYETVSAKDLLEDGKAHGARASLSYGGNGQGISGSLAGYGVYGNFDWFVMLHAQDGDNYDAGNGREMPGTAPAAKGALVKLGYEMEGGRIELAYDKSEDDADRVIKMNMDLNRDGAVFPLKVENETLSLTYTSTAPTEMWDPEAKLYLGSSSYWRPNYVTGDLLDPANGSARPNGDMVLDRDTFGGVLQNTFSIAQGTITAGVDFSDNDYSVNNYGDHSTAQPRIHNFSTRQVGTFAQGRFEFANGFDLSTGLRYDHQRFEDWNNDRFSSGGGSANATLSYRFNDMIEVFAGASHTWMGYDVGEYGLLHARNADFATDPDFEPATAKNYKIGVNASGANWKAGLTFFDTRLDKLAEYDVEAGLLTNGGEGRSKGFTLNAGYEWTNTRIGASYTKADVTTDGDFALPGGGTFMPIGDMASVYIDHVMPQYDLKLGATLEWAGELSDEAMEAAFYKPHDSYSVVNAYAEWSPAQLQGGMLRLGVDNLFDETYYERTSYVIRAVPGRDIQPAYAPGRTLSISFTKSF
ncbi:TonB-dependent receptor [Paracoccus sp. S1E-3]|uniref:TonB-dependent receptor domain-containing protein n=1 Tax=Paracoccus sp. S1E-3 TaxID=2756130 RepID=UPI002107CEBA|nr:TonB-dependent receptor [Paracoccus sp. S1E-3]